MVRTDALVSRDPREPFTVEQVDVEEPRADEILVRLVATGICHTDLVARGAGAVDRPVLVGHEGAGIVERVGSEVTKVRPGDHVILTFRHCGVCANCAKSRPAYCQNGPALNQFGARADGTRRVSLDGARMRDGFFGQSSFAGYAVTTEDNTVVIDADIDLETAAPLGCSIQTGAGAVLNALRPGPQDSIVVYGVGGVGMAALLAAVAVDVGTVVVVEPSPIRRALASELGAHHVVDPGSDDVLVAVRETTKGGASHALDTTGNSAVIAQAFDALGIGGALVTVALGKGRLDLDLLDIVLKGKTIRGCLEGDCVPATFVLELLRMYAAGAFPIDRLVTRYPFAEINVALEDNRRGDTVKPVLLWT